MILTEKVKLNPLPEQATELLHTMKQFNLASSWLAKQAFQRKLACRLILHKLFYQDLREKFGLKSQMAIRCIASVSFNYKRDRRKLISFRPHTSITFDKNNLSRKDNNIISISSLEKRLCIPFTCAESRRKRLDSLPWKECKLQIKNGTFFLCIALDIPEDSPKEINDFLGLDLGVINIATTSNGEIFSSEKIEQIRTKYLKRRKLLQRKAAKAKTRRRRKNIRRASRRLSGREANFRKNYNHILSKKLVCLAKDTNCGIALEDLKGIRKGTQFRKAQRAKMAGWSFFQLRSFIEYKARLSGVPVEIVNPINTSRTCSRCGMMDKKSRKSQDKFECSACSIKEHADINAARNIKFLARATSTSLKVSEGTKAQRFGSGTGTSHPALAGGC